MSQRRGLQGLSSLRKKLRNMEKIVESGIKPAIRDAAIAIQLDAIQRVSVDNGDLQRSIDFKISPDGLAAVIGPSAKSAAVAREVRGSAFATRSTVSLGGISKKALFQFFKGYWLEFGTKGAPDRNIPPQQARPFMQPAYDVNKAWAIARVKTEVDKQLKTMAGDNVGAV
jgi:HK97 gp10 family phage protein